VRQERFGYNFVNGELDLVGRFEKDAGYGSWKKPELSETIRCLVCNKSDMSVMLLTASLGALDFVFPWRFTIIVKLCPFEEGTTFLPWCVARMTHPHVATQVFRFSLYASECTWYLAVAFWCESWVEARFVVSVGDIDSFVSGNWVWINGIGRNNAVLPIFLHLSMHDEQRVVRQMN
jgi:hypothetical protein